MNSYQRLPYNRIRGKGMVCFRQSQSESVEDISLRSKRFQSSYYA